MTKEWFGEPDYWTASCTGLLSSLPSAISARNGATPSDTAERRPSAPDVELRPTVKEGRLGRPSALLTAKVYALGARLVVDRTQLGLESAQKRKRLGL